MSSIAFAPATKELFVRDAVFAEEAAPARDLALALDLARLRQLGWPAPARLIDTAGAPGSAALAEEVSGVFIELLDALPILAAGYAASGPDHELRAWQAAARLALELVQRGRLIPKLVQRGSGRGWEARWRVAPATAEERAELQRLGAQFSTISASSAGKDGAVGVARRNAGTATSAGPRLLRKFLDAAADTLVREASRRGALVRLGNWPSSAWEQRLIRALGDDRPGFYAPNPDVQDASAIATELAAWVADQSSAAALSLLPSPSGWQAPEPLSGALRRMLLPANKLAEELLHGRPAPRTLPATTWLQTALPPRARPLAA